MTAPKASGWPYHDLTCAHLRPDTRAPLRMVLECPECGKRSADPGDMCHGWCGRCKAFVTEPHPVRPVTDAGGGSLDGP